MDTIDQVNQEFLRIAEYFYIVSRTRAGKKMLEHLKEMTDSSILTPNHMFDGQGEIAPSDCAFIREGQNQVIRYIERLTEHFGENK